MTLKLINSIGEGRNEVCFIWLHILIPDPQNVENSDLIFERYFSILRPRKRGNIVAET